MWDVLIAGGTLIDAAQGIHDRRDVAFADGKVAAVGENLSDRKSTRLNSSH